MERQREHAERGRVANHAIGCDGCDRRVVGPAGSDDELANAVRIRDTARILRIEAFVNMVVAVENHVRVGRVELLPEPVAVLRRSASRAEERDVPVGQDALVRVRREVGRQPQALRRSWDAAADIAAIRVERDQVPGPDVEAVPALALCSGGGPEVVEVAGRPCIRAVAADRGRRAARGEVLVVAGDWVSDRLDATPCRIVGLLILGEAAAVMLVSEREDRAEVAADQQVRSRFLLACAAVASAIEVVVARAQRIAAVVTGGSNHGVAAGDGGGRT